MKKTIWTIGLCVLLLCSVLCVSAAGTGYAQVKSDPTVNLGQTITFTVTIDRQEPVLAVMLEPVYDEDSFELVGGEMLQEGVMADFSGGDGVITWAEPTDPNGALMFFTLKPKNTVRPGTELTVGCNYTYRDSEDQLQYGTSVGTVVTVWCEHTYTDERCDYCGRKEFVAQVDGVRYSSVQEAVDCADGGCVQLLDNWQESVFSNGNLCLDLNGYVLRELTVDGLLYGMDTSTADYDCADGYGRIQQFTGRFVPVNTTGSFRRYVAFDLEEGLSFHRIYVGVTHMSLQAGKLEFGYKLGFYGDQVVKEHLTGYGVQLWVDPENKLELAYTDFEAGSTGNTKTVRVQNILSVHCNDQQNAEAVTTDVTACGYAALSINGQRLVLESDQASGNLKGMLAVVNNGVDRYTHQQIKSLQEMILANEKALELAGCQVENILSYF